MSSNTLLDLDNMI